MENKLLEKIKGIYFIAVSVLMYYFLNEYIGLGLYISFRHAFALVLVFSAVVIFLFKPDVARGVTTFKEAFIYSIPLFVTTVVSLFIWFVDTVDVSVMTRGLSTSYIYSNMFSAALGTCTMLYIFGSRGIWYNLISILIANILIILTIVMQHGLGNFLSEFITLVVTFAGETGDIIVQAEVHELAFCLGAYLIYMLYKPKKNVVYFILLFLSLFCFLTAFKRIAIIAMVIALFFGYILKFIAHYNPKSASRLVTIFTVLIIAILIGYIAIIKGGVFELLEKAGINTTGRAEIYNAVDKFYEFNPEFLGNGIGFLSYQLTTFMSVGVNSVHNDFLQHFIDLGFWGYIIWLITMTLVRTKHFGKNGNVDSAIITFILLVYLIVVSSTDNTMNYPLLSGVLAILMIGNNFDKNTEETEMKLFGHVNKKEESDSLL